MPTLGWHFIEHVYVTFIALIQQQETYKTKHCPTCRLNSLANSHDLRLQASYRCVLYSFTVIGFFGHQATEWAELS